MSARDYVALWLNARKGAVGGGGGAVSGGNVLLAAPAHAIDGPSHTGELPEVEELIASVFGVQDHGSLGSSEAFDASVAGYHVGTLDADCTFTFAGATTGDLATMVLELTQDATGGRLMTLPGSVPNAAAMEAALDLTLSITSFFVFFSRDGGVTWYGFAMGGSDGVQYARDLLTRFEPQVDYTGSVVLDGAGNPVMVEVTN